MTRSKESNILYRNARGITVTTELLSTRNKDEALAPVQSVQIGREPLAIALVFGLLLCAFAWRTDHLLYDSEQMVLGGIAIVLILLGYVITPLRIGQLLHNERTVFWSTIWTARSVRRAIAEAKRRQLKSTNLIAIDQD